MDDYYVNPRLPLHAFSPLQAERHQMQCHPEFPLRVPTVRGEDHRRHRTFWREKINISLFIIFSRNLRRFFAVSQAKNNSGEERGTEDQSPISMLRNLDGMRAAKRSFVSLLHARNRFRTLLEREKTWKEKRSREIFSFSRFSRETHKESYRKASFVILKSIRARFE